MPKQKEKIVVPEILPMDKPDLIVGLDMSLAHTGYAVFNTRTGETLKGLVEPDGLSACARLIYLRDKVYDIIHTGGYFDPNPNTVSCTAEKLKAVVFIEGYAFGAKGQSIIDLGELGGVVRVMMWENQIPYFEIPPTKAKKFVTGKGTGKKDLILREVFRRWDELIDDDNVADAFGLMQMGRALFGLSAKPLVQFQKDVVMDVVKSYLKEKK